ncbi:hypothetical protein [Deinococcus murrayi]|uniref:hypothetical protein n=1 Tax=Deinococcus murrayi TaxID=68910 RepID=UPI0004854076|nr:hypothetical protein [Deinococcus murrayi]
MNAQQWLERTTRDLPAGVAGRVERETRAHLQDAGWPEDADVRAVLGDPEATNEGLRRLYLTAKELEEVTTGGSLRTGWNLSEWLAGLVVPAILLWEALRSGVLASGLGVAVLLTGVALTWDLHPARRRQWRLMLMLLVVSWLNWLPRVWEYTGWPMVYAPLFSTLIVVYVAHNHLRRDARLRRTLQAEEGRA